MDNCDNSIQPFKPEDVMSKVKDRIKATFVELIPDNQWNEMLKAEADKFFQGKWNEYSNRRDSSEFQELCQKVLVEMLKEKLKEFLESYKSQSWENGHPKISKELEKIIVNNVGMLLQNMIGGAIQSAINSAYLR